MVNGIFGRLQQLIFVFSKNWESCPDPTTTTSTMSRSGWTGEIWSKTNLLKWREKKSRTRETKHLSTDADSSTDTKKILLVRQNSPKNNFCFARRFYTLYEQKCSNLRPLLSITFPQGFRISKKFGHWTSGSGGKETFKLSEKV